MSQVFFSRGCWGLVLLCAVTLAWAGRGEAGTLTLENCIELAVAHDPATQNSRTRIDIGKLKRQEARQKFLPKLDVQAVVRSSVGLLRPAHHQKRCV